MIFKNRRGEMPWYVIALVLAIIVLLVSLGAVWKIRAAQSAGDSQIDNTCATIAGGTCKATCETGEREMPGLCPKANNAAQKCCKPTATQ